MIRISKLGIRYITRTRQGYTLALSVIVQKIGKVYGCCTDRYQVDK
jgi:hypothetical protein